MTEKPPQEWLKCERCDGLTPRHATEEHPKGAARMSPPLHGFKVLCWACFVPVKQIHDQAIDLMAALPMAEFLKLLAELQTRAYLGENMKGPPGDS